jgi:hypothetical protein
MAGDPVSGQHLVGKESCFVCLPTNLREGTGCRVHAAALVM